MRIAIFGTGGVGGNFGGYLARAGCDVTFIARGLHLKAMQEHGLRIENTAGDFLINPVKATDDPAQVGTVDVILLCTKLGQLGAAADAITPMIGPKTFIIPLQNSVEAPDFLAARLGPERILGGLCYTMSWLVGPGVIHGSGNKLVFGELDPKKGGARAQEFADLVNQAEGISAENAPDIQFRMWKKFTWVASAGAIGSITRAPLGAWRKIHETKALFETILGEAFAVAETRGVNLSTDIFDEIVTYMEGLPESTTTSMQRDIMAGSASELEHQVGAIVRIGEAHNVPVPLSKAIYSALLPQELHAQGKVHYLI